MAKERKAYAPFSLTSEAGVAQTPVEGYIDVKQQIYPTVGTGTINENGKWVGVKASDTEFIGLTKHVAVPDAGETLSPDTGSRNFIDMTGFSDLMIAIFVTRTGNYGIRGVMGPDTNRFANIQPVNSGTVLNASHVVNNAGDDFSSILNDAAQECTADVWNIFMIFRGFKDQKNLQFKITNNSGGQSDIEFGFMRLV